MATAKSRAAQQRTGLGSNGVGFIGPSDRTTFVADAATQRRPDGPQSHTNPKRPAMAAMNNGRNDGHHGDGLRGHHEKPTAVSPKVTAAKATPTTAPGSSQIRARRGQSAAGCTLRTGPGNGRCHPSSARGAAAFRTPATEPHADSIPAQCVRVVPRPALSESRVLVERMQ